MHFARCTSSKIVESGLVRASAPVQRKVLLRLEFFGSLVTALLLKSVIESLHSPDDVGLIAQLLLVGLRAHLVGSHRLPIG